MNEESVIEMRDALSVIMTESLKSSKVPLMDYRKPFTSSSSSSSSSLTSSQIQQASLKGQSKYTKMVVRQKVQSISYVISEAISGGTLHDLYKSFSEEMWLDKV